MATAVEPSNQLADLLGVVRVLSALPEIAQLGTTYLSNASYQRGTPTCAWDSSEILIPHPDADTTPYAAVLVDIGGTQTKVGYQNERGEFSSVFDHPNTWFKNRASSGLSPLESFLSALIAEIQRALPLLAPDCRLGLIWSNQVQCVPIEMPHTVGVSGIVRGTKTGGYRKGEWFLGGVRDGDDIGALFLRALGRAGWRPSVFLLGNDTIFTLFAMPHSTAGVVMSSGGNCTAIGEEGREMGHIINTELGGHLKIPEQLLSDGDRLCASSRGVSSLSLEELSAGTWFPELVSAHICAAAQLSEGHELVSLRDALVAGDVTLNNRMLVASLKNSDAGIVPEVVKVAGPGFRSLLQSLVTRAGALAGVLCYLSISSQLANPIRPIVVSLDSSMARHFPGFFDALVKSFEVLRGGCAAEVRLVTPLSIPGGDISVPMQGVARALNSFSGRSMH